MIINSATSFADSDVSRFAWSNLRSFDHVPSVTDRIMRAHSLTKQQKSNAQKQAADIRACLVQAREYHAASQTVSLATRPVLLYYSIMALAIAQSLFKGTGDDSLQRAREKNAHHGLVFTMASGIKSTNLADAANALRARPMIVGEERRGTFELWQRHSREGPLIGPMTHQSAGTNVRNDASILMAGKDERTDHLPANGKTFFDCLEAAPCMAEWLHDRGIRSKIVRASASALLREKNYTLTIAIHPHEDANRLEDFKSSVFVETRAIDNLSIIEQTSCFTLFFRCNSDDAYQFELPSGSAWTTQEARFINRDIGLNEFGIFLVGLFILSNVARYYPDYWMKQVEEYTPLADAAQYFIDAAEARMALLTLNELTQKYYISRNIT